MYFDPLPHLTIVAKMAQHLSKGTAATADPNTTSWQA